MTKVIITAIWISSCFLTTFYTSAAVSVLDNCKVYHVSINGDDSNAGTSQVPLKTIFAAAQKAMPGDTVLVHAGIYRERIDPPRGGYSDALRITYQSAKGEEVIIKGSEIIKGWKKLKDDIWTVTLPNSFFCGFNPYAELIHGDYMFKNKMNQHVGQIYLNESPLIEAASHDELTRSAGIPYWFGQVSDSITTLWIRCQVINPNEHTVEINVRPTVFYPSKEHINYITVRGFFMSQAAANWAPPTAEQVGLIGTHWSKGWLIENNIISHARCVGITLGKFGDKYDNTYAMDSQGWQKGVQEAIQYGWSKESVGHHRIIGNTISFCGQAGIVGSLGAVFSKVTGNTIHDIAINQRFAGYETAGIKFHAPIDVLIAGNHIYRAEKGIWLDWMSQGTHIEGNLFHDNLAQDLFVEVNHGPMTISNNIFLSKMAVLDGSSGGAYCHNLFSGRLNQRKETRTTPIFKNHSVEFLRLDSVNNGDERFYNNIFIGTGLDKYSDRTNVAMQGNSFLKGGKSGFQETQPLLTPIDPKLKLVEKHDGWYLQVDLEQAWDKKGKHPLVTTELLGKALTPNTPFENADGSPIVIDTDYFGQSRNKKNPFPGPFENKNIGMQEFRVWPICKNLRVFR